MRKEYVITEIVAAPDGAPYVLVSLADPKEFMERQRSTRNQQAAFTSPDELFKNIGQIFSMQMMGGMKTVIKLGLREYDELEVKVGDKLHLDISKVDLIGV
ncbi:MAG: hypothetical protein ABIH76_05200 [Candidatus Bathyarchaeota archaeon]